MENKLLSNIERSYLEEIFQKLIHQSKKSSSKLKNEAIYSVSSDSRIFPCLEGDNSSSASTINIEYFHDLINSHNEGNPSAMIEAKEVENILKKYDLNRDGFIDKEEFFHIMTQILHPNDTSLVMKEVRVRMSIKRILEIDIVNQQFTSEFFVEASWIDDSPALQEKDIKLGYSKDRSYTRTCSCPPVS